MDRLFHLLSQFRSRPVTGGQRWLRLAVFAIFASAVVLAVLIAVVRAGQAETACRRLCKKRVEIVKSQFTLFLKPVADHLRTLHAYGRSGILDPSDPTNVRDVLIPPPIDEEIVEVAI